MLQRNISYDRIYKTNKKENVMVQPSKALKNNSMNCLQRLKNLHNCFKTLTLSW